MSVSAFPLRVELRGGVSHAQAMEIIRRFGVDSEAAPTVADRMGIPYDTVCEVLDGQHWPGARNYWMDRVFP